MEFKQQLMLTYSSIRRPTSEEYRRAWKALGIWFIFFIGEALAAYGIFITLKYLWMVL